MGQVDLMARGSLGSAGMPGKKGRIEEVKSLFDSVLMVTGIPTFPWNKH